MPGQKMLMQKSEALSPVQEEAQYANSTFWILDPSKDIAKEMCPFSLSAAFQFVSIFWETTKWNEIPGIEFERKG